MKITTDEKPAVIKLDKNNKLTIANTIVMVKDVFDLTLYDSVILSVYSDFFAVEAEKKNNKGKVCRIYSDTWGFNIQ